MKKIFQFSTRLMFAVTLAGVELVYAQDKPNSPILILADQENFGFYSGQLLNAEGFKEYTLKSPSDRNLQLSYLRQFDLLILARTNLTRQSAQAITSYVQEGGSLIVFYPHRLLDAITGVQSTGLVVSEGYIKVDDKTEIGSGIISETIQLHGMAGKYVLKGAKQIAALFSDSQTPVELPAVVIHQAGRGQVVSFLYNLPESIVYARQGNRVWKDQERDGMTGVRHIDMFVGVNNETNWINKGKVHIPQADEQLRLLSHAIEYLFETKKPLPRLWYFPAQNKSLTILTCDGENTGAKDFYEANINTELTLVKSKGGVMSVYLIDTGISFNTVNRWRKDGHEVAIHFDNTANAASLTQENMSRVYDQSVETFRKAYDRDSVKFQLLTVRNHWITWVGWSEQAKIEMEHGFHLDFNAYKFDNHPSIKRQDWIGGPGYYTGSGIPMKFAGDQGEILDIYQSETQIIDEQLGRKGGIFNSYKILLDRSLDEEKYAVITANVHPNGNNGIPYLDELMRVCDYANERKVPLWNGAKLYHFLKTRDEATFDSIQWKGGELSFRLNSTIQGADLSCMIPLKHNGTEIAEVRARGKIQKYTEVSIKGKKYAFVTVGSGERYWIEVRYGLAIKSVN